jgi:hypothetical protein
MDNGALDRSARRFSVRKLSRKWDLGRILGSVDRGFFTRLFNNGLEMSPSERGVVMGYGFLFKKSIERFIGKPFRVKLPARRASG